MKTRPKAIQSKKIRIENIHEKIPGRVRYSVSRLYRRPQLAAWVQSELMLQPGIHSSSVNPITATVLVLYDPRHLTSKRTKGLLRRVLRDGIANRGKKKGKVALRQSSSPSWYSMTPEQVERHLRTSQEIGLTRAEARVRLKTTGQNRLPGPPPASQFSLFYGQFTTFPVLLLMGASVFSVLTGGLMDAGMILAVVLLNGTIGYLTESTAEKTIRSLIREHQNRCQVMRNGKRIWISKNDLVPGDLLLLLPGTAIPADARLIRAHHLSVDESILTGESLPASKSADVIHDTAPSLGDQRCMVFRGTQVTGGSGKAIVVRTGVATEMGQVQLLTGQTSQPETPLQRQLRHLGDQMVVYSLLVSTLVLIVGLLRRHPFGQILRTSTSLAIAAIPESLPTIATTTLAQGIKTLEKEGVIVRHLEALEALGAIDTLCLDKTGTITLNQMSIVRVATYRQEYFKDSLKKMNADEDALDLCRVAVLCNEASLVRLSKETPGSSTELSLLRMASDIGLNEVEIRKNCPAFTTRYRSENRSFMSTFHRDPQGYQWIATKGRPDQVLNLCTRIQVGGRVLPLKERERQQILAQNQEMALQGLRVLGFAYRQAKIKDGVAKEERLIWLGLAGLEDPIRPRIEDWIQEIQKAQIRTVMITGDQSATAYSVGKNLRLNGNEKLSVMNSSELSYLRGVERKQKIRKVHVFSRVNPSDKLEIVRALQSLDQVVGMIGDGINDGPALKVADVGIALGKGGAEVTSKVADIILLQDQLEKVLLAIREGRRIQDDIKKAVDYILTQNFAEMFFTLFSIILGMGEPLTPMQLLWVNLVTDIFPELALAQEPAESDVLQRPPSHATTRFLNEQDLRKILFESGVLTFATLGSYFYARQKHGMSGAAKTQAFLTLISSSLLYTVTARSKRSTWLEHYTLPENVYIPWAVGAGFAAEGLATVLPMLKKALGTERVTGGDLLIGAVSSIAPLFIIEFSKVIRGVLSDGTTTRAA